MTFTIILRNFYIIRAVIFSLKKKKLQVIRSLIYCNYIWKIFLTMINTVYKF